MASFDSELFEKYMHRITMRMEMWRSLMIVCAVILLHGVVNVANSEEFNFADALNKSILFFEGQRSGRLPATQRMRWRKDSGPTDGHDKGVDLTGGYYDAGDNVKFHFPMAFTATMLAWGVHQYGRFMGGERQEAAEALRWATDYFLKCTATPGVVYAQVGDPNDDHNCWERPEDMDTPRTTYAVTADKPGSEVSAEMAAAMAAASLAFRAIGDREYARVLLQRAVQVFLFADTHRGSYNDSIGQGVCPFYCDYNGYKDELLWAAAWLLKATKKNFYWDYISKNIVNFKTDFEGARYQFGWDAKNAGVSVLLSKYVLDKHLENSTPFLGYVDDFVCNIMPESPNRTTDITPGGLLHPSYGPDFQVTSAHSFLLLTYSLYIKKSTHVIRCGSVVIPRDRLIQLVKSQMDYILGKNPMKMSYIVGYGDKYPRRLHHRGSSLPSVDVHPQPIRCKDGTPYFMSPSPNPNELTGAVPGGPDVKDNFQDDRANFVKSEPTTYINAPLVGLFAFFKARLHQ